MNGERDVALETAPDDGARRRSRKRTAAVVEPAAEATRQPVSSAIAEEDETLYAQYGIPRIPPAIPYIAPDDLPVPGDDLSDPDLPYWLALNRVKGIGPARFRLLAGRLWLGGGGVERRPSRLARGGTRHAHDRGAGTATAHHRA